MLKIENLKVHGLPPLSFEVPDGECLAVEGPSGSGKTLLLRAIADLDPADGHIYLDGVERATIPAPLWRHRVRYLAAEAAWWAPTPAAHFPDGAASQALLASLDLDPACLGRSIGQLSTGERQRLALLRALIDAPDVLLLDEPTSALDSVRCTLVETLIEAQLSQGVSILLVSHEATQVERLAHARLQLAPFRAGNDLIPVLATAP